MKKLDVIVRDKTTLVLEEDGVKGDIIDLTSISNLELTHIESLIDSGKDEVYNKKLIDYKKQLENAHNEAKNALKLQYEKETLEKLINKDTIINDLENKLKTLNESINKDNELLKLQIQNEFQKNFSILKDQHQEELDKKKSEYEELYTKYLQLQNQKASLNVKMIGESLEIACNNEVTSYMQNGLLNCTWVKDTTNIKEDDEAKASKADFLFKVYLDETHKENELLTSVCLEMKDENPDSKNKKTNADYYNKLDKNRTKKACKYALLVSNLETDNNSYLPIYKVNEYPDMYVVRPGYLMVFLNMIVSLSNRYKELILSQREEQLELQHKLDLSEAFESLKKTYLENPLEKLTKQINDIQTQNNKVLEAIRKSNEICDNIFNGYIRDIQDKLNNFDVKINREYKKLNK